jgi:hypothetical protein
MKRIVSMKKLLILSVFTLTSAFASPEAVNTQVHLEREYYEYQQMILEQGNKSHFIGVMADEQKLYIDALEDALSEYPDNKNARRSLQVLNPFFYDLADQLRVAVLKIKYTVNSSIPVDLVEMIKVHLLETEVDRRLIYLLAANQVLIVNAGHKDLIDEAKKHQIFYDIEVEDSEEETLEPAEVYTDLLYATPDITTYMNGEYINSVKVVMFCRLNRLYPCLMTVKDVNGEIIRNADGSIWTHPALASSSQGLPSYVRNGNTPAGVYTIDSVMPTADQQISFGKNRRMILNFIPASEDESLHKSLLPASSAQSNWWKSGIVARDIGRNLLRIHGTGKINKDPSTPYFPFMRTSGCVAQRENTYSGVKYNDQRVLLDQIMKAMELAPSYANEVKVKGIFYLIELNDKNEAVTTADLLSLGIN